MSALQFFDLTAPLHSETVGESVYVKGFASVALFDREREVTDPSAFDIPTFLNSPTLLRNHKYISDKYGNAKVAGSVKNAVPAYIAGENPENKGQWVVKSIGSDEFVDFWPKSKSPRMLIGDRGLFVMAEATHPMVIDELNKGELGGFSWRGWSNKQRVHKQKGLKQIMDIDLVEISLVNVPCQPQATLMVTSKDDPTFNREVSIEDCNIHQIEFGKDKYNLDNLKEYTKNLNISTTISENKDSYFVHLGDPNLVEIENSFSYPVGDRNFIFAPKKEDKIVEVPLVGQIQTTLIKETAMDNTVNPEVEIVETKVNAQKLFLLDFESFMKLHPNAKVECKKSMMLDDVPVDINTIEFSPEDLVTDVTEEATEEVVTETTEEVSAEATTEEATSTTEEGVGVTEETTKEVEDVVLSEADKLLAAITQLTAVVAGQATKQAELESTLNEIKSAEEIKDEVISEVSEEVSKQFDKINKMTSAAEAHQNKLQNQLSALGGLVTGNTVRRERVEASKSSDIQNEDPMTRILNTFGRMKEGK